MHSTTSHLPEALGRWDAKRRRALVSLSPQKRELYERGRSRLALIPGPVRG